MCKAKEFRHQRVNNSNSISSWQPVSNFARCVPHTMCARPGDKLRPDHNKLLSNTSEVNLGGLVFGAIRLGDRTEVTTAIALKTSPPTWATLVLLSALLRFGRSLSPCRARTVCGHSSSKCSLVATISKLSWRPVSVRTLWPCTRGIVILSTL